jgi:hypothetical protein
MLRTTHVTLLETGFCSRYKSPFQLIGSGGA